MPIYTFQCDQCESTDQHFRHMADRDDPEECDCGGTLVRVFDPGGSRGMIKEYDKPIEMMSIACQPGEIAEFQRRNPDAQISTNPKDPLYGVPIARTRQEKLAILDREGFLEK